MSSDQHKDCWFLVATYTRNNGSAGIYVYRLDGASGKLSAVSDSRGTVINPSYVAFHPSGDYVYAVSEIDEFGGKPTGGLAAFRFDQANGQLSLLNQQPTGGTGPCYVSVDATGQFAFAANYAGGSASMLPIRDDGSLAPLSSFHQHEGGSMVHPQRQNQPHAHCIYPVNGYVFVPDLGLDRVVAYKLDAESKELVRHAVGDGIVPPGSGPRHFCVHPNGQFAYVINEIGSTITAFSFGGAAGTLTPIETISSLPKGWLGRTHCADVHISPDGAFLYGSNRGHDSIAVCAIDTATGKLTPIQHEWTQGEVPRGFALDPSGRFLFAANQNTNNIAAYERNPDSGTLSFTGQMIEIPTPVCIKMLPIA